jgi:hypothetical protein
MTKLPPAQARIIEAMKGGAFIRWSGIGVSGRDVLHIPTPGGVADYETRTVPSATMGALVRSGLIKRVGSALSRDSKWIAAHVG